MSIQYGQQRFDGAPVDQKDLNVFRSVTLLYGPDGGGCLCRDGICIAYGGFSTTKESGSDSQPHSSDSGLVVTWDGRLDNRQELVSLLSLSAATKSTDVAIVVAAYERWGTACFSKLLGDWALSIWVSHERTLILAKDFLGCRHLYYHIDEHKVLWSTVLDPLISSAGELELNEEYIAGWFSMFPAAHLTPYRNIHAVPPSSYVIVRNGRAAIHSYWTFDPEKRVRYRSDAEYEEHFRTVFAQSVRRRLRSENTIVAELSGGMDSSSIVCMADLVLSQGGAETDRVETVSYYDDSEPNWNERPYFTKVEEQRGRTGCHIDVGAQETSRFDSEHFAAAPGSQVRKGGVSEQLAAWMTSHRSRVLLSGIGGDEATGGVPTPVPELADLLTGARFNWLAHQLKVWALKQRRPWIHLFFEVVREFLPAPHLWVSEYLRPSRWLDQRFVRRNRAAIYGYPARLAFFGPSPSYQENIATLNFIRRHLATFPLPAEPHYEKRYPYLDRDLLEFLYAVPREQLVRPGQRRSLMRRSLIGIVPEEILNRKRKAYVARSSNTAIVAEWNRVSQQRHKLSSAELGIVIAEKFAAAIEKVRQGHDLPIVPLFRTLALEAWLSQLAERRGFRLTDGHAPEALAYSRSLLSG